MTQLEIEFACFAINTFGTGQHPMATEQTFEFFARPYIRKCVKSALATTHLSSDATSIAEGILNGDGR